MSKLGFSGSIARRFQSTQITPLLALVGLLLGAWLGQGLTRLVAATVSELYYNVSVTALHLDASSLLLAAGLGVLATLMATLIPAWHAAHTPPLTTLSRAALETSVRRQLPVIAALGGLLLAAGLVVNEKPNLARPLRRRLRSAVHHRLGGRTPFWHGKPMADHQLLGRIAFLAQTQPAEAERLQREVEALRGDDR